MEGLMKGKRGLIMGIANDHSIAWGIAQTLAAHGAEMAFTYQGEAFGKRVAPLAEKGGAKLLLPCDVEDSASVASVFDALKSEWGSMDFLVHAIGFSDKNELKGLYADTSRDNFTRTMVISCFSFTEVARHAAELMTNGGSLLTLTYAGSVRVMPNYNVMGVDTSERAFARTGAHAGGRWHCRRALHVLIPAAQLTAAPPCNAGRDWRLRALYAFRPRQRRYGRSAERR